LTENIIHDCIYRLIKTEHDDCLLSLCNLITIAGKLLDTDKAKPRMDQYFSEIARIALKCKSNRVKFALREVLDLRRNHWVPRKVDTGLKMMDELHKDSVEENLKEIGKRLNLIVYNLPESAQTEEGEDKKEDTEKVTDIICHLNKGAPKEEVEQRLVCISRLGRRRKDNQFVRPVRVEIDSLHFKERTLKNARLLKDYIIPGIGLSHDKTRQEMEDDRELRCQLMERREADTNVKIETRIKLQKTLDIEKVEQPKVKRDKKGKQKIETPAKDASVFLKKKWEITADTSEDEIQRDGIEDISDIDM